MHEHIKHAQTPNLANVAQSGRMCSLGVLWDVRSVIHRE